MKRPKVFYGWYVVAACFMVMLTMGEAFWSFGIFVKPLENEFGWSRSVISSAYTVFLFGFAISSLVSGRLTDRYNPRPILLISAVIASTAIGMASLVQEINQLRFFYFMSGLGAGAGWLVPASATVHWFYGRPKAGAALGITVAGAGFGAVIFAPLINYLVLSFGWRTAFVTIGVIFFVVTALSALVIRPKPAAVEVARGKDTVAPGVKPRWTTLRVLTTPSFIAVTLVIASAVTAFQTLSVHLVPHSIDTGMSPTASAVAYGLIGGFSVPGRLASGFLADRIGWHKVLTIAFFGMALSVLWIVFLGEMWMLYAFVFFYGTFHGFRLPSQVGILEQFYGKDTLGELLGITTAVAQIASAFAPYVAAVIFDRTGSYTPVFIIMLLLFLGGGITLTIIKKPS
ncbi:MAG: MFS transporter [Chloroflexi bacterium]|nr:MFS transporter [Chloroflexota bacterium]